MNKVVLAGGMNLVQIDGFLHGLLCRAGTIAPSDFLPAILGSDAPSLLSDSELREAARLVLRRYNQLAGLVAGRSFYADPLISPLTDAEKALERAEGPQFVDDIGESPSDGDEPGSSAPCEASPGGHDQSAEAIEEEQEKLIIAESAEWAKAFLNALDLAGDLERLLRVEDDGFLALAPVLALFHNELPVGDDSPDHGRSLTRDERELALKQLPASVSHVYRILHSPVRKSQKLSRNDPCPCGSGKKYKKCCLN